MALPTTRLWKETQHYPHLGWFAGWHRLLDMGVTRNCAGSHQPQLLHKQKQVLDCQTASAIHAG